MIQDLLDEMQLRGFTPGTIKAYNWHVEKFLESRLSKREYLLQLTKNKSPSSVRLAAAVINFYETHIQNRKPEHVPIPKKRQKLPSVLSKQEILAIIDSTTNDKHKIIVELLYSSGLRLQELINLRFEDIDFASRTIHVKQGKGQKDRITIVGRRVLDRLDRRGTGTVLKGRKCKYSKKSVQMVIQKLAKKADIRQKVTPHMLRHSFATYLLENGTDLRYIQALLGHRRLESTQIYTRVAKNKLSNIRNPLDE